MPLQATSGAASYDAFGGGVPVVPAYIEEVFSTYLYRGNQTARSITNGIDLSTKGGLVWIKDRTQAYSNGLFDTARGVQKRISSNSTSATQTTTDELSAFNVDGFSLGNNSDQSNATGDNYASWTFRKQPKFFDVVTWTGDGTGVKTVTHNLGSVPGCIIVKHTSESSGWWVYHRGTVASGSPAQDQYLRLETTDQIASAGIWNNYAPTSTDFQVNSGRNTSGQTYVAYIFAHDAGGFGLTGTENVITCGYYLGNGAAGGQNISLGYEPQYLMTKIITDTGDWNIADNMRGWSLGSASTSTDASLQANTPANETQISLGFPTATGFQVVSDNTNTSGRYYIYIAIRRGPMKVPTIGTSVFSPILSPSSDALGTQKTTNFPVDMQLYATTDGGSNYAVDRLRAVSTTASNVGGVYLYTNATDVEGDGGSRFWNSTGFQISNTYQGLRTIYWNFRRAPSFMDVVCYRGSNTSNSQKPHNLKAVPELIIIKSRNFARHWNVYHKDLPPSGGLNAFMEMDSTDAINHDSSRFYSTPTADNFILGNNDEVNGNYNYVAYLFSTCAGVSKVFSYTGNGSSQTINCGFTAGARWIMIKRTNSSGDWYIWDSARGIVSGSDPHLSLNTTAAEVTTDDTIDTDSTGFVVNQVSATNVNVSSSTYIGIAIA